MRSSVGGAPPCRYMFRGARPAGLLLQGRDAVLPGLNQQVTEQTEFELITWLVIGQP